MSFIPVYILILAIIIVSDYFAGIYFGKNKGYLKKTIFILSIILNIGVLFVFKYYNFFNENIGYLINNNHFQEFIPFLSWALPIGLSYQIFQSISYKTEIYRGSCKPERNFIDFALYIMLFTKLIAGPIEKPQNLIPQLKSKYYIDYERLRRGFLLIICGFFMKLVIADRLAIYVDVVYGNPADFKGTRIWIATYFYAFQIYCDFSGYTSIARGISEIFGFRLIENFRQPYLSQSVTEFWRRWHISLSSWLRDYLFSPLSVKFRYWGRSGFFLSLLITFLICGFWHGANWTFIIWGLLHAIYMIAESIYDNIAKTKYKHVNRNKIFMLIRIFFTFNLIAFAWIFFRADSLKDASMIINNMFHFNYSEFFHIGFFKKDCYDISKLDILLSFIFITALILINIFQEKVKDLREYILNRHYILRWAIYYTIMVMIFEFGVFSKHTFIYFQF